MNAAGPATGDRVAPRPSPLTTSVVGSHAHPGWLGLAMAAAERGELGPADIRETLDDAVNVAIREQEAAGIDVVTDGEMRRAGFFTAEFYGHLTGVVAEPVQRRLGPGSHDHLPRYRVVEPIAAPAGLGVVEEFLGARGRTTRRLKVTLPGPFTLSGRLLAGAGHVYRDRLAVAEAFVPLLRAEIAGLVRAGATWIQVDEPSPAIHPEASDAFATLVAAAVEPARADGGVRLGAHLCFGNFLGRPLARRSYRPIIAQALAFPVDELVLEFANRELGELDVAAEIAAQRDLAAGVVDVKSSYVETAEDVAGRIERLLDAGVPEDRLHVVPDCGFSQTPRAQTVPKLRALVAGRDLVLGRMRIDA